MQAQYVIHMKELQVAILFTAGEIRHASDAHTEIEMYHAEMA